MGKDKKKMIYDIVISVLALIASIIAIVQILNESISSDVNIILNVVDNFIWVIFVIDYVTRLVISKKKLEFILHNKIDLISILPFNALLKALRVFKIFRVMKLAKLMKFSKLFRLSSLVLRFKKNGWKFIKTNNFDYILFATITIILLGAVGMMFAENKSFTDSLWWSFVTTTTVGYGDISPESHIGRIIAAILMITGIGFVGMLTGTIATFFLGKKEIKSFRDETIDNIKNKLDNFEDLSSEDVNDICKILKKLKEY